MHRNAVCIIRFKCSQVTTDSPPGAERGLFCKTAVSSGEPLLAIPWELCLVAEPQHGDVELLSPWHVPLTPSCESRLAGQLLATLDGDGPTDETARLRTLFWRKWMRLLPSLDSLSLPIALPEELRSELQHRELETAGRAQVRELAHAHMTPHTSSSTVVEWQTMRLHPWPPCKLSRLRLVCECCVGRRQHVPTLC